VEYPSKLIEEAVNQVAKLPGIGKKTALRLVLHLIKENKEKTYALTNALSSLREGIKFCKQCHNISDDELCDICSSHRRDKSVICVVEDFKDVMAIENTSQYNGLYHILGGVISPINGVGPAELQIESLISRISETQREVKEIILAISPTMEGDTTAFYINKKLKAFNLQMSTIARGIPIGGELEFTDEITLGRSILSRIKYD
jgi:recombination protein RecR